LHKARRHHSTVTHAPVRSLIAPPRAPSADAFAEPTSTKSSVSDNQLITAAALLLLLVAAAASVLRVSARMLDDIPSGRFG
jgi:hypothetical protein